ncbi:hypothetical protein V7138_14905 [Bacillus sp. JJ1533]|uniref:hypothetical protein n=1 Tax=Bacillus sp. JJ1533 TaxID=3122959 RepID=UPI002FFF0BB2
MFLDQKIEFFLIPNKTYIRVDVYDFGDCFEAHASSDYGMCIERGETKSECVKRSIERIKELNEGR